MENKFKTVSSIAKNAKERAAIDAFSKRKAEEARKSLENVDWSKITGKKEL